MTICWTGTGSSGAPHGARLTDAIDWIDRIALAVAHVLDA
ncbi:hypothetical protein JOC24_002479 [Streptomyces sp. HB132]|nr:hypothetical protein [Streptomyces sp. HB132]